MEYHAVAVIGDLVRSREHPDRAELQQALVRTLADVNAHQSAQQDLEPTIGDEFQGVYPHLAAALSAALLVRLSLPEGADCRVGIGAGGIDVVGRSNYGLTQDGPAWWSARTAIEEVKRREQRKNPTLRSWFVSADGSPSAAVNAYLLSRDHLVSDWSPRSRRLAAGMILGETQADLAAAEGISQSAVSQGLHACGAMAVAAGLAVLKGETTS